MTDFWFNHFNVSLTDNQARLHLLSYERDAIAPGVLGRFRDLLSRWRRIRRCCSTSTTRSRRRTPTPPPPSIAGWRRWMGEACAAAGVARHAARADDDRARSGRRNANRPRGLNENYARELLELHTLGVDGGYTQEDVIEVARAFTGWTVLPPGDSATRRASACDAPAADALGAAASASSSATAGSSSAPTRTTPRRRPCSGTSSRPAAASRTARRARPGGAASVDRPPPRAQARRAVRLRRAAAGAGRSAGADVPRDRRRPARGDARARLVAGVLEPRRARRQDQVAVRARGLRRARAGGRGHRAAARAADGRPAPATDRGLRGCSSGSPAWVSRSTPTRRRPAIPTAPRPGSRPARCSPA